MQYLTLVNLNNNGNTTVSILYVKHELQSFVIQNPPKAVKVMKETRLRDGVYPLKIRDNNSAMNERYAKRYGNIHKGMIEIIVPDFINVYFHIGNKSSETDGCPLPNTSVIIKDNEYIGQNSAMAYVDFYTKTIDEIIKGDKFITIKSLDLF